MATSKYEVIPITVLDTFSNMPDDEFLPYKRNRQAAKKRTAKKIKFTDEHFKTIHKLRQQGYMYKEISEKLDITASGNAIRAAYTRRLNNGYFKTCP